MLAIYVRISKEDKTSEGISLDNQKYRGVELAKNLNIKYKIYEDAGKSGELPVDKRPSFLQMFKDIESKIITTVYVLNQSRLDRGDLLQFITIIRFFKEHKITYYENQVYKDYTDVSTELSMNLLAVVNHNHNQQVSANITSALQQNIVDGKVSGGPLINYGYTKDEKKKLVIEPTQAKVVKDIIFKLALEKRGNAYNGTKYIASELNRLGIPTKRMTVETGRTLKVKGKDKSDFLWRDSTVYRILKNPIAKGIRIYKGKEFPAPDLAIVSPEVFDTVQQLLKTRNYFKNTTNKYDYLLKGLIQCPNCNGIFAGHKRADGRDNAYKCNSFRYEGCGNRGINIDYLDELVIDNVCDLENIILTAFSKQELVERTRDFTTFSKKVEIEIKDIETNIENLLDLAQKTKNISKISERIDSLTNTLEILKEKKHNTDKELTIIKEKDNLLMAAKEQVKEFKKARSFDTKAAYLQNIIRFIRVFWDDSELVYCITISFKLNQFENYLIAKELIIDRNSRKDGKAVTKILNGDDDVSVQNFIVVDEESNVKFTSPSINYTDYLNKHKPGYISPRRSLKKK